MSVAIMLFTRDLRVHDQAALTAATAEHEHVVPLFVLDEALLPAAGTPNRTSFLLGSLGALRASLRGLGGDLVVRRGDVVAEAARVASETGAKTLFVGEDVSVYAQQRVRRLRPHFEVRVENTLTAVAPGELTPEGRDHYRVFTPYWRRWRMEPRPPVLEPPYAWRCPGSTQVGCPSLASSLPDGRPPVFLPVAKRRGGGGLSAGSRPPLPSTTLYATTWPPTVRPASVLTCTSAASRRTRSRLAPATQSSSGSFAGVTSTRNYSRRTRTPRARISILGGPCGTRTTKRSRGGAQGEPGCRSSTRVCGSCTPKGGCTTAHA